MMDCDWLFLIPFTISDSMLLLVLSQQVSMMSVWRRRAFPSQRLWIHFSKQTNTQTAWNQSRHHCWKSEVIHEGTIQLFIRKCQFFPGALQPNFPVWESNSFWSWGQRSTKWSATVIRPINYCSHMREEDVRLSAWLKTYDTLWKASRFALLN